ncbi:hypothetical protein DSO57_1015059 [Entomophthora muscae]|uniref:Uncharacterized protein n=1 Tax=Entomophthora muscae TaxID=34485 RepID=A0ACC2SIA4_9FUNG|nr:hypothetical protein DSO57_1015059 [Entomophthora muscae]
MHFFRDLIQYSFPKTHKIIADDSTVAHGAAQLHNGKFKTINEKSFHTFSIVVNSDTFHVLLLKGVQLPTLEIKKFCLPHNLQNLNISVESDDHQILLCKPMDISAKRNMREFIFGIKLRIDINGLVNFNFYTLDPILFLPFEHSTLNHFEIIDIQPNVLTILERLQLDQARNDIHDYKTFIVNLRLFIINEEKKGRNRSKLISLHNVAVSWL